MAQARSAQVVKKQKRNKTKQQQKKWGSVIYSTDKENKANKMFTLWLTV